MSLSVHIRKKLGNFKLQVDLEHPGGVAGILGASGCGKSLTLQCIAGIAAPDEGRIVQNGRVLFDSREKINQKPQKRRVGYLFQNYALFPHMTVEQNILCGLYGEKDRSVKKEKLEKALRMAQLTDYRNAYPSCLSGGQQQRTALVRILVGEPELLLLDEPFGALDSYLRDRLQGQVKELLEKFGQDALLVSHSREEICRLCSYTALAGDGRILKFGRTKEVFQDPGSRTGAVLTGCKNLAPAYRTGEYEAEVPEWGIRLKTARPVGSSLCGVGIRACAFRPGAGENAFPVTEAARLDGPFEETVLFRYAGQKEDTPELWWSFPRDQGPKGTPKRLGVEPGNVLLLYPEEGNAIQKETDR